MRIKTQISEDPGCAVKQRSRILRSVKLLLGCLLLTGDRLTLALTGTAVSTGTLATNREALTMAESAVAGDVEQTLDAHLYLGTQLTFNLEFVVDDVTDGGELIIVPFMHFLVHVDRGLIQDVAGGRVADPIDVGQTNLSPLILGKINTGNTGHICFLRFYAVAANVPGPIQSRIHPILLSLALLEAGVLFVDDEQLAFATHDLTICATLLDGCPDFHNVLFYCRCSTLQQVYNYLYLNMIRPLDRS